jgi:hypothetical protein
VLDVQSKLSSLPKSELVHMTAGRSHTDLLVSSTLSPAAAPSLPIVPSPPYTALASETPQEGLEGFPLDPRAAFKLDFNHFFSP